MKEERAEYIENILSGVMNEKFYSKIVPRIKSRRNRVYLGTVENETVDQDRTNDTAVLKLFFKILNCQSTQSLQRKAIEISEGKAGRWSYALSEDDTLNWVRKPRWTLAQAALISIGLCPENDCDKVFEEKSHLINTSRHPILPKAINRYHNLIEHEKAGAFFDLSPSEFVNWFVRYDYDLPAVLDEEIFKLTEPRAKRRDLNKVSETTLLKMIAGMSFGRYEFDPRETRGRVTQDIKSDLERCGINLDPNTIRNCLRAASKLVHPDRYRD